VQDWIVMVSKVLQGVCGMAMAAAVVACASMRTQPIPEITFAHLPPITLNVSAIDVQSLYQSPRVAPHVEHQFPVTPEQALRRWAQDRLRAGGGTGQARFLVTNAAVTEEPLPRTTGFIGAFKTEPDTRYTATIEATLEIIDTNGRRIAAATTRATRTKAVDEGVAPAERALIWRDFTDTLMRDFDGEMVRTIRSHLSEWVM
jgi:hypothetical protein